MRKFILLFIISVVSILPFKVSAVELEKSFEDSVDGDIFSNAYFMTSYDDNGNVDGYIAYNSAYSENFLIKFDLDNNIILNKENVIPSDLKITMSENNYIIKRTDLTTGNTVWEKTYDSNDYIIFNSKLNSYDANGNLDGYFIPIIILSQDFEGAPGFFTMKYSLDGKLLWTKSALNIYDNRMYIRDKNGDLLEYTANRIYAAFDCVIKNLSNNTIIDDGFNSSYHRSPIYMIDKFDLNKLIVIYGEGDIIQFGKYTLYGEEIFTKKLNISNNNFLTIPIHSISLDGKNDGLILGSSGEEGNLLFKFDYDGNIIWKKELLHIPRSIIESYDKNGEFNGYVIFGYDEDKSYITKLTYPKKVIESKNSDVEVISEAYPGKVVTLTPKEKEGYIVKRVIVRDSLGNEIEVSSDNTFVMPDDDVSIEVIYEKRETIINPDTASTISIVLVLIAITIIGTVAARSHNYLER